MKEGTHFANVFDAVAGRVTHEGIEAVNKPSQQNATKAKVPLRPDEVLFRSKGAPERYAEDDLYEADRRLGPHQTLPDSDLLKAIHVYASDFYANKTVQKPNRAFKSMDETALLAMGILMEEAAREVLGETGDLVFTEADDHDEKPRSKRWNGVELVDRVVDRTTTRGLKKEHTRLQASLEKSNQTIAKQKKRSRSKSAR